MLVCYLNALQETADLTDGLFSNRIKMTWNKGFEKMKGTWHCTVLWFALRFDTFIRVITDSVVKP